MSLSKNLNWFGQNVKIFRTAAGLTQEELSEKVGISSQYLSYIESATRKPSLDIVAKISSALNISISDLFLDSNKGSSSNRHKEIVSRISQLTKDLSKEDQEKVLKIVSTCIQLNR